jgi:dTDP-4-amino-4,6-dideoxygalactose transaminase
MIKPKLNLRAYPSIGQDEIDAVNRVLLGGVLSGFYGSYCEQFFGGSEIKDLEREWSTFFGVKHSVTVNSAASGLLVALGSIGIGPGDEVIVPATTMSATAMAPLIYGAIPVFADIDRDTYNITVETIETRITSRTKAIVVVNLFGQPADLEAITRMAHRRGIYVVEDNAQSITAKEGDRFSGTIGDIGVFSLNYHKHIHSGEGGVCCTDSDTLCLRMQLIRNHGENLVEQIGIEDITNLVGFNLRMTEMTAAVARVQLKNVSKHVGARVYQASRLIAGLKDLHGLEPPMVKEDCSHSFYILAFRINSERFSGGISKLAARLNECGFPCFTGYVKPLYTLPVFKRRIAIGSTGFPFNLSDVKYEDGLCPEAEALLDSLLCFEPCAYELNDTELDILICTFKEVHRELYLAENA